jgi:hypothetical protein
VPAGLWAGRVVREISIGGIANGDGPCIDVKKKKVALFPGDIALRSVAILEINMLELAECFTWTSDHCRTHKFNIDLIIFHGGIPRL